MLKKIILINLIVGSIIMVLFIFPLAKKQINHHLTKQISNFDFPQRNLSEEEITAFHEAGHALIALNYRDVCEVKEISIIPKNKIAGYTNIDCSIENPEVKIATLLGGSSAEKILSLNQKIPISEVGLGSKSDHDKILQILKKNNVSKNMIQQIVEQINNKNMHILHYHQQLLKKIVGHLLYKKILKQQEIKDIYKQYILNADNVFDNNLKLHDYQQQYYISKPAICFIMTKRK